MSDEQRRARRARAKRARRRRRHLAGGALLGVVALIAGLALFASGSDPTGDAVAEAEATVARDAPAADGGRAAGRARERAVPKVAIDAIPPLRAGTAEVVQRGPAAGRKVALTFDDGFCADCVTTLIRQLERTGAHATLFPNGTYGSSWAPHARAIRRLVAAGQVIVGSHTFSHVDSPAVGAAAFGADLDRNERWIQQTFGLTGRPYLRPPYGAYDAGTLAAAGERGYTKVVMWSGTVADSNLRSRAYILNAIEHWARPGAIILLHANYPPTAEALPEIVRILRRKRLRTATLQELIGGSPYRPAG
nr:polysaccharide deacetylase family protein [Conexibacter arvalis]